MASSKAPRPSRPNEHPSRHSISATSSSRLKDAHVPLRSYRLTPPRAKLKHAATSPPTSVGSGVALSSTSPHACYNCHQMGTRFYCDLCLRSRIEAHHNEMRRLSLARDKVRASMSNVIFDKARPSIETISTTSPKQATPLPATSDNALPDPFDFNTVVNESASSDPSKDLLLHSVIQLRAQRSTVVSRVQAIHRCTSESQHAHLQGKKALKEKLAQLARRKQNLAKAWSSLEGSSASTDNATSQRSRLAAKSRWLAHPAADHIDVPLVYTDVYTHYERQSDDLANTFASAQESTDHQLNATLARTRLQLASLQSEARAVSTKLAAKRAELARQAFRLYTVSPPDARSSKATSSPRTRHVDLSASSSVAQRISRLSERYIPGAFGLGHANSPSSTSNVRTSNRDTASTGRQSRCNDAPAALPASSNNWCISNLPLPLPSEVRRYPRDTVNGAVTYAANLMQLLASYLGIALPFSIEQHKGRLSIRPDPLWDGGGGSSAKTLYLSSSAYAHLTASHSAEARNSKLNNLAESTLGLGASTLSTIESYIHLPSGTGLPWGLASNAAGSCPNSTNAEADTERDHRTEAHSRASSSSASSSRSKPDQAAKSFVSALVMLCYNVVYLATKQGLQLDLVAAAASPLHLLSKMLQQPELGRLAHANHIRFSAIQDLSLSSLDYEQLAQILEPSNAGADGYKRGASRPSKPDSGTASRSRQSSVRKSKTPRILEQSYVDVGDAAASVLGIKDPTAIASRGVQQPYPDQTSPQKSVHKTVLTRQTPRLEAVSSMQHGGAEKRSTSVTGAQPSLDFLRQRGRDASKPKGSAESCDPSALGSEPKPVSKVPQSIQAKVGPGAVIFNGVEVGVGNVTLDDSGRPASSQPGGLSQKSRKHSTEEGWDLV